jgi:hypothetical protein
MPDIERAGNHDLAKRFERRAQLRREQLRVLPHCEVAAPVGLVEVDQVAEGAPGPCLLGAKDLFSFLYRSHSFVTRCQFSNPAKGGRCDRDRHGNRRSARSAAARPPAKTPKR